MSKLPRYYNIKKGGVSHFVALAINIKRYEGKRCIMKNSNIYITMQKYNLQKKIKILSKRNKILQNII